MRSLRWRERAAKVVRKGVYAGVHGRARGSEAEGLEVDFSDFSEGGFIVSYREVGRS